MKISVLSLAVLAVSLVVIGCTFNPLLIQGTVVDKRYEAESDYIQYVFIDGVAVPTYHHEPEKWVVTIEGVVDGVRKQRDVAVSHESYYGIKIGDYYIAPPRN